MCAALPDNDAFDGPTAVVAGLASHPIHLEVLLKIAAGVNPIEACAIGSNACCQNILYGSIKCGSFDFGKSAGKPLGV